MRVVVRVNSRGQITIPAAVRRELGLVPGSAVDVIVRDDEIVLRRVKTVHELAGSLSQYAKKGEGKSWHEIREETYRVMGEEYGRKWGVRRGIKPRPTESQG